MVDFITVLGMMSIQASFIIPVVFVVRKLFSLIEIPKKYSMMLWFLAFFFLVFPWKITLPVGFWHDAPVSYQVNGSQRDAIFYGENEKEVKDTVRDEASRANHGNTQNKENTQNKDIIQNTDNAQNNVLLFILWGAGVIILLLCNGLFYHRMKKNTLCSVKKCENIFYGDDIKVPMVMGIIRPQIYIPSAIDEQSLPYVIAHEKTHIKRKDSLTKLLAYGISCVHWFNPLVWLAYWYMAKDMEMTCDEETLKRIGVDKKNLYAKVLLQMSAPESKNIFAVPLAFGEGDTKHRIINIMHHKKAAKICTVTGVLLVLALAVVFISKRDDASSANQQEGTVQNKTAGKEAEEKYPSGNDGLENFLRTKPKIEDWMDIKLPEGYTLDSYQGDLGYGGAALILPQVYEAEGKKEDSFAPAEWLYAGVVGRIPGAKDCFSFKNGKLQKDVFPHENHSSVEKVKRLDDLDWPAILLEHYNHDIYTGGQLAELMEQGIEPTETTSDYWHFFFVKEGEDVAYYLALTSKEFTREEAIAIARTVKIK